MSEASNIIIYNTDDGKTSVSLLALDGQVWFSQQLLAELFDTSVPNVNMHTSIF
jgi:Virulence protein